eukprot:8687439-Pyramimonas_sp.AAC.1
MQDWCSSLPSSPVWPPSLPVLLVLLFPAPTAPPRRTPKPVERAGSVFRMRPCYLFLRLELETGISCADGVRFASDM